MVVVTRLGQSEHYLQEPLHRRCEREVAPAHDIADTLRRIVDDDGEMVRRPATLAREDEIAPRCRVDARARPGHRAGAGQRARHVEAHARRPRVVGCRRTGPARARIHRRQVAMRRARARRDFGARAGAAIGQPAHGQAGERVGIGVPPRRLVEQRGRVAQPQPGEIGDDAVDPVRPRPLGVEILDPDQENAAWATATSCAVTADSAWPRWSGPVGLGAKREITA